MNTKLLHHKSGVIISLFNLPNFRLFTFFANFFFKGHKTLDDVLVALLCYHSHLQDKLFSQAVFISDITGQPVFAMQLKLFML